MSGTSSANKSARALLLASKNPIFTHSQLSSSASTTTRAVLGKRFASAASTFPNTITISDSSKSLEISRYRTPKNHSVTTFHVILRKVNDSDGSRLLKASLNSMGDVIIEGRDYGAGVERVFGVREYEWAWTIPAASVPALLHALEATSDVLSAISRRFSGDRA